MSYPKGVNRPGLDRLFHEFRYSFMYRKFKTSIGVEAHGRMAGRWGRWRNKCPYEDGHLRGVWLCGWSVGRDEFEKSREKPKGDGPRGGRRVKRVA